MASRDDDVKQAIGQVAKLGGFNIKRVATTDDLKDHTITITITRISDGWHQDRLPFEDTADLIATIDGNNGHVDSLDPNDLTEKDETLADVPDPGELPPGDETEKVGAATGAEQGQVVDLNSKKRR